MKKNIMQQLSMFRQAQHDSARATLSHGEYYDLVNLLNYIIKSRQRDFLPLVFQFC
jgi:hypothetical protein